MRRIRLPGLPITSCATSFTAPLLGGITVTCACDATGTANPILVASRSTFTCDARDSAGNPIGLSGKLAAGGTIRCAVDGRAPAGTDSLGRGT